VIQFQQFQQQIGLLIGQPKLVSTTNKGPPTEFQEQIGMCCFQGQFNGQPAQFQQQIPPQQQVKLLLTFYKISLFSFTYKATMSRETLCSRRPSSSPDHREGTDHLVLPEFSEVLTYSLQINKNTVLQSILFF
jgi:hypothetical protein